MSREMAYVCGGKSYPSWEALLDDNTNGWAVVAVIDNGKVVWPYVEGPFTKEEAERKRRSLRRKWRREQKAGRYTDQTHKFFVRPTWKGKEDS